MSYLALAYCVSSNKRQASNDRRTISEADQNKRRHVIKPPSNKRSTRK